MAAPADETQPLTRWQRLRAFQRRVEVVLSSRKAVATAVVVAFAALGLAIYVEVRQINLTNCIAAFNEASARRTVIVSEIAAEDRRLDRSDAAAENLVELARREDERASRATLLAIAEQDRDRRQQAFVRWLQTSEALQRAQADAQRIKDGNAETRARNEAERRRNPVPEPPSQRCD